MSTTDEAVQHLDDLFEEIRVWQQATFPEATLEGSSEHLVDEADEGDTSIWLSIDEPTYGAVVGEELADVLFMVIQCAWQADVNLAEALAAKLAVNRARTWQPANDGVVEHER